jgi:LysM repeat protein
MNKFKLSLLLLFLVTFSIFSQEKKYTTYQVQKGETLESITRKLAITPHDLLQLNPDIKEGVAENQLLIIPNKNYNPALDIKIGDYIKEGFLFHKVLPKENYFRLKQQFGVPKRILRKYNLALRTRPKETKYSIARRYGISIERLEELNPEIKEGLKLAQIIKVPDTKEIPNLEENFVTHQVEKGETIFSLSQIFKMSQEQLIEINPELTAGLKEGMLIKIPTAITAENKSIFTPNIPVDKHLNVAILLPFSTNKGNLDFEKDRTLNIVTDFYLGALEALNLLKKQGLSVTAQVFDTENKKSTISNILRMNDFGEVDAIIGPMFMDNVEFVTNSFKHDSLAIISPVSSKDHSMFASNNLIKEMPSEERLSDAMILYLQKNYTNQQLVLIADSISTPNYELRLKGITKKLNELDSLHEVIVLRPENGYIKPDLFKESILEDKGNWIVLFTEEEVLISDAVNNLGVLPKEFDITLFCLNYGKNFERVDNNFLARVNFHYPTASFVDLEDIEVQKFINRFKANNYVEPSEYAFKGFDMTYDALLRLATYSDVGSAFDGGISERMSCKFHYTKNPNKGFENNGVFLVKYDGLNLVNVEKEPEFKNE